MAITREQRRKWRLANLERERERLRLWRKANPKRNLELQRRWRENNPEEWKDICRRSQIANRVKRRSAERAQYQLNPGPKRESARRQREKNPDYNKQWFTKNPEKARELWHTAEVKRRDRKRIAFVESVSPAEVYRRGAGVCGICREAISEVEQWHVDHIIPLSKGGEHSYRNVQPAHGRCNKRKSDSVPVGWNGEPYPPVPTGPLQALLKRAGSAQDAPCDRTVIESAIGQ